MAWCLRKELADKFKQALKDRTIDPNKMESMTSKERHRLLLDYVGKENVKEVNAMYESKLLLKNKQAGYISWAKRAIGMTPEVKNDIISRIKKMDDRILNPENEKMFLNDLAEKKLGVGVTEEEAKAIFDLSQKVKSTEKELEQGGDRLKHGAAIVELENLVTKIKDKSGLKQVNEALYAGTFGERLNIIAGTAKSVKASLDNSALFRQGWKALWTDPKEWGINAYKSFSYLGDEIRGIPAGDAIKADIYSRPNALNGKYKTMQLDVGLHEEAYPTSLPEKIPIFGRLYKASEVAYTGFLSRLRADLADKFILQGEKQGVNFKDKKQAVQVGKLINSMTGRGQLPGGLESSSPIVNVAFFSAKFLKSNIDTLLIHPLGGEVGGIGSFGQKKAAGNLAKIVIGTAAIMLLAKKFFGDDAVEIDPRSSDFGKIKIGDTRFDVTGGMGSITTLASRIITQESKSTSSGAINKLGTGYGQTSPLDVVESFFENKMSPILSVMVDLIQREDRNKNPLTIQGEISNFLMPLPISSAMDSLKNPDSAPLLAVLIADGLGIAANTYSKQETDWNKSTGKELLQMKEELGQEKFNEANKKYNNLYNQKFSDLTKTSDYKKMTSDEKNKVITNLKDDTKKEIFDQYGFKYQQETTKKTSTKPLTATQIKNKIKKAQGTSQPDSMPTQGELIKKINASKKK